MTQLSLDALREAALPGGPNALSFVTQLEPAAGPHSLVAPAKYSTRGGPTYVFEDRYIDGRFRRTVLLDSRSSNGNRLEEALNDARRSGHPLYSRIPGIVVRYASDDDTEVVLWDTELPHRFSDAHIRLSSISGEPTTQHPDYRAARNATPGDARALFEISPLSVLFGCWDSTRRAKQARFPAAVVGETIGVITDTEGATSEPTRRSGARIDPVGASVQLDASTAADLARTQAGEMSEKKIRSISKQKGTVSTSNLGLGAIPPGVEDLDGIATTEIIRSQVVSFATLRRLRFGHAPDGDAAIRTLLAALTVAAITRSGADLYLRANCHLVESGPTTGRLDRRSGQVEELDGLTVDAADAIVAEALADAEGVAGLDWRGQVLEVVGNPEVLRGALSDEAAEEG